LGRPRKSIGGKIKKKHLQEGGGRFSPPPPPPGFCVSAGMIGVTGEWAVSVGMIRLNGERQLVAGSSEFGMQFCCRLQRRGFQGAKLRMPAFRENCRPMIMVELYLTDS